jgi:type VI secretion system protein ImpK
MTKINNQLRLADYCSDVLSMVLKMRINNDFGDEKIFRDKIRDKLNQMEIKTQKAGISSFETEQAKFALIALTDEFVITSDWKEKENWIANPLQMEIYGRFDAGEEFFKRLMEFQLDPLKNSGLIEIYFICMGLGFKGKYAISGQEELGILVNKANEDISKKLGNVPEYLSPSGIPEKSALASQRNYNSLYMGLGTLLLGLIFYLIITLISIGAVENTFEFLP